MATSQSQVPLHCSICPKQPKFSDVSHLLTHIASKSHLSHYYKIKIRAAKDQDARQQVHLYDTWYDHWDVETLMSERLALKDEKNDRRAKKQASRTTRRQQTTPAPDVVPLPTNPFAIDPQFAVSSYETPGQSTLDLPETPYPSITKNQRPRLHLWPTSRAKSSYAIPLEPSSPLAHATTLASASLVTLRGRNVSDTLSVVAEDEEPVNEAAKLKGILWPGMNIFDAALPEARRRRNQKKETSVVERLRHYAADVEPNEMIWTASGSLWKERPITGQVDFDSSPYRLQPVSPDPLPNRKSGRTARRTPLREKDVNTQLRTTMLRNAAARVSRTFDSVVSPPVVKTPKRRKRKISVLDERQDQPLDHKSAPTLPAPAVPHTAQPYHPQFQVPTAQAQHQVLDTNFAAYYQPAIQPGYYPGYDLRRPPMYHFPIYAPYGHVGYDLPGFFSYPPQVQQPDPAGEQQIVEHAILQEHLPKEDEDHLESWNVKIPIDVDALESPSEA